MAKVTLVFRKQRLVDNKHVFRCSVQPILHAMLNLWFVKEEDMIGSQLGTLHRGIWTVVL